jgi:hypothetical protein
MSCGRGRRTCTKSTLMGGSNIGTGDEGFATPAAAVISLAIAVAAAAVTTTSIMALHEAQADNRRMRAEFELEGDQAQAALQLMGRGDEAAARWSIGDPGGATEVIAEPEAQKLSLQTAPALSDAELRAIGAGDPARVRSSLAALAAELGPTANLIASLDSDARWSLCARSAISPYGAAGRLAAPPLGARPIGSGRLGELWRFRLARSDGWVDDRIVRFTGSNAHPVAVAAHWFGRGSAIGGRCAELAAGAVSE